MNPVQHSLVPAVSPNILIIYQCFTRALC